MLFSLVILLSCTWTATLAGNDSSVLNVTQTNVSTITTARVPSMIFAHLPKSIRTKANLTVHTTTRHPKVKDTIGAQHNKLMNGNTTMASKLSAAVVPPATVRNLSYLKNGDQRSNSSRLLDRFASISKVSLASLASSKVSTASNKTSTLKNGRAPVSITVIEAKNILAANSSIIAKRSVHNSTMVDRASLFFQNLPVTLVNTTSNVTSWVKRLFTSDNNSSSNTTTKRVTRETNAAELEVLVNSSETNKSSVNSTAKEGKYSDVKRIDGEETNSLGNASSVVILTSVSIEQDAGNLTADVPTLKESNSSFSNATNAEIKQEVTNSQEASVDLASAKLNGETMETTGNTSSVSKSVDILSIRTKRHNSPSRYGRPASLYYTTPALYPSAAPVYGMLPAANAAPAYGMAPAPTPAAPVYGMASTPAPASAPVYEMAPAPTVPVYGVAPTPAPAAPIYAIPPILAPAFPSYGVAPTPAPAAPVYGMAPVPAFPSNGMAPVSGPSPAASVYGMAPAPAASAYGLTPVPPPAAPAYGMAPIPSAFGTALPALMAFGTALPAPMAFGVASAAPMVYEMATTTPSYIMQTESYYTAPQPMYTTSAPYDALITAAPYAPSPISYPPKPYGGSMPSRPSASGSPWF